MAHHQILTDDELAMLRDLGSNQESHLLSGHLDAPMLGLLQKADNLVLEARFAGHQLRFPLTFTKREDGFIEPRLSAPEIRELGFARPRAWRLNQKARLRTEQGHYQVLSLSLNGLIVENMPLGMMADTQLNGELCLGEEEPLSLLGRLVRLIKSNPGSATWAISFQMSESDIERLRHWFFQRHQDTFSEAYQAG